MSLEIGLENLFNWFLCRFSLFVSNIMDFTKLQNHLPADIDEDLSFIVKKVQSFVLNILLNNLLGDNDMEHKIRLTEKMFISIL